MPKPEKPLFGPALWFRVLILILSNGLLIALVAASLWLRAVHDADAVASDSAAKILSLVEQTLHRTEDTLARIQPLAGESCAEASNALQSAGSLSPYVRSLFLVDIRQGSIYCASSQHQVKGLELELFSLLGGLSPQKPHLFWSDRSPLSPYRAVVLYRPLSNGHALAAVLEGRNFEDVLQMMTSPYIDRFTIDIPPMALESNRGQLYLVKLQPWSDLRVRLLSREYNLRVSVHVRSSLIWMFARSYLPLALALVLGFFLASVYLLWRRCGPSAFFRRAVLDGIAANQFEPFYQPIVLPDGALRTVEVLIRWRTPQHGLLPPTAFVAQAEALDLLTPVMISLLRQVETDMVSQPLEPGARISINLSARQLGDQPMLNAVRGLNLRLKQSGYQLIVEITEEGLIRDAALARQTMQALRDEGGLIAIDDFGVGHSSLSYLRQFPFDYLKIDKSFVDCVPGSAKDTAILEGIVTLAKQLGLTIVAEGVEFEAQAHYLHAAGVDYLQGYLFARPLPLSELVRYGK